MKRGGEVYTERYDTLVLATGSTPLKPRIPGIDSPRITTLWTVPNTDRIRKIVADTGVKSAVVVGGGFIGVEMAENLRHAGLAVTLVEMADQVMNIDELDISKVSVGQTVQITADAVEGKTYEGEITKVSVAGTTTNGTTSYPVTVKITDTDGLLPGMMNGTTKTLSSSGTAYSVTKGGFAVRYSTDGSIKTIKNISSATITDLGSVYATASSKKYRLADDVQVYLNSGTSYYATTLSAINTDDYTLTGWYDSFGCSAGGRIRVITAVAK